MRNRKWPVMILLTVFLFGILVSGIGAAPSPAGEKIDVLIGFQDRPSRGLVEAFGGEVYREFTIVNVIAARLPQQAADALASNPAVKYVEPDGVVYAVGQSVPWGVDRVFGDESHLFPTWSRTTGEGVGVAILDTGIEEHEDLDVAGGYNAFTEKEEDFTDGHSHGTHVAGTVAALDNDLGVVGVAPDVDLYAVKVLDDSGRGTWSSIIAGIEWAVDNNIPVMNMSLGGSDSSQALEAACDAAYGAGHLLVAAAGNETSWWPFNRNQTDNVIYPAKYESVIAVSASDSSDNRASFSSNGPEVELIAPGVSINSTILNNKYGTKSGTSMASPHVAGAAALVWAAVSDSGQPDNDIRDKVKYSLLETAECLGLDDWDQGEGLVRADLAVKAVADLQPPATGNIGGTVKDKDGGTIEGATVVVEETDLSATTGSDGNYLLQEVPTGDQDVTASADGYVSQTATVTVEAGATVTQDFTLEVIHPTPTYTVSGSVNDSEENGLENATVTIEGTEKSAVTDSGGYYSISGIEEDTYDITASKEGYISETKNSITVNSDTTANFTLAAESTEDPPSEGRVNVSSIDYLTSGGRNQDRHLHVTIELKDDTGNPVSGASVTIELYRNDLTYRTSTGTTNGSGKVTFSYNNAPSGTYSTVVTKVSAEGLEWGDETPENSFTK